VPTPTFQLSLLGRFELAGPDGPIDLTSRKLAGLLAFLACSAPEPQSRDQLMALLWGSHFEAQARQNLRQALTRLRRVLGEDRLISTGETISLKPGAIGSDVARFETLLADGSWDGLKAAVGLYRGQLLGDIAIPEEAWTEWLGVRRQRLEGLALDAMLKLGEQELQLGNHEQALSAANRAIAINNLREDAHRLVIRTLAGSGRRAGALKHYEYVVALLKRELGVEPDPAIVSLAVELRKPRAAKPGPEAKSRPASEPNAAPHTSAVEEPDLPDGDLPAGERKHVTALYADLKESLELVAQRDPEEALRIFEAVLKLMTQAVHRYEGTVTLVTGDGIMALFGVPLALEDHAVRACYAALQIQGAVTQCAKGPHRSPIVPILVRAGLNSGEVVIRSIANGPRTEYRAMGQTTHVAGRLGQSAAPGALLVSAETFRLAEGHVQVKPLEPGNISGLSEVAYELVGAEVRQSRFQARAARGLTGFVGRSGEIEQLEGAQAKTQRGRGQVVTIIGEPGLGKSRLVHEFIHSDRAASWMTLESACLSYGTTTSYHPVVELLKSYFGIDVSDDVREVRNKVADRVLNIDRALAPDLPALMALLDIPVDDSSWQAVDGPQRRQRTLDALKRLIFRQCQQQPVILVCEDLHWVDSETQAFLETLIDGLASAPLLLILTYRPEYEHHWGGKSYYTQLRLDDLSPEATQEFLTNLLGADASLTPLKEMLPRRGTPFFLEEAVRALIEIRLLEGKPGDYRLVGLFEEMRAPPSVHAILAARMDRLPARQKWLLQAASVVGRDVPHAVLRPIVGLEEDELRRELAKLREAEFLYEARLFPDLEYAFKHALTHEVAYGGLLADQRKSLHRQIVGVIEQLYHDRLAEQIERLARHARQGELWEKAVDYARRAGNKAAGRWALQDARTWFEQALAALQRLPETQLTLELGFDIRFELRPVLVRLGEGQQQLECVREAVILAEKLNDDRRRGQVYAYMTNAHLLCGSPDEALVTGNHALEIAKRVGDLRLRLVTTTYLEHGHHHRGEYGRVVELATDNLAALPAEWTDEYFGSTILPAIFDRYFLIVSLAELGRFKEAAVHQAEVIRLAERTDHAHTIAVAHEAGAELNLLWGNWARARSLLETAIMAAKKGNLVSQLRLLLPSSAWALAQLGETGPALNRLHEGLQLLEDQAARGYLGRLGWGYYVLGCACLQLERLDEAKRFADLAVERSPCHPGFRAHGLQLLADIEAHEHRFNREASEASYRAALVLAEPRSMLPLVAHCHRGLAEVYRRTGEPRKAQGHLTTAMTMYRDMDMRFWLYADTP
jgi:DNA-binding SARP family transcriptional activator